MQKYIGTAIKKDVNNPAPAGETPAVNVDVRVVVTSTGELATIYSDNGITTIDQNNYKTDANGNHEFYAANGRYTVRYLLASGTIEYTDIVLEDPNDRKATTAEAQAGTDDAKFMTPLKSHQAFKQYGYGALTSSSLTSDPRGIGISSYLSYNSGTANCPSGFGNIISVNRFGTAEAGLLFFDSQLNSIFFDIQSSGSPGTWLGVTELWHQKNLINAQNTSGSTVTSNATVAGSGLTPVQSGTWRNIQTSDVPNNSYGIFKKV